LIFSIEGHIPLVVAGFKIESRRPSDKYKVGNFYAIQPARGKPGIPDGKILIVAKREEEKTEFKPWYYVLPHEAKAEGGYTPEEYEELYEGMYPSWQTRWAYLFKYYPTKAIEMMERGEFPGFMLQDSSRNQNSKS